MIILQKKENYLTRNKSPYNLIQSSFLASIPITFPDTPLLQMKQTSLPFFKHSIYMTPHQALLVLFLLSGIFSPLLPVKFLHIQFETPLRSHLIPEGLNQLFTQIQPVRMHLSLLIPQRESYHNPPYTIVTQFIVYMYVFPTRFPLCQKSFHIIHVYIYMHNPAKYLVHKRHSRNVSNSHQQNTRSPHLMGEENKRGTPQLKITAAP